MKSCKQCLFSFTYVRQIMSCLNEMTDAMLNGRSTAELFCSVLLQLLFATLQDPRVFLTHCKVVISMIGCAT